MLAEKMHTAGLAPKASRFTQTLPQETFTGK